MSKHVLILAGGTGGHVFPALAVAEQLREQGYQVSWAGTEERLEARVVPAAGFAFYSMPQQGLRGRGIAGWLAAPWRISGSVAQARQLMKKLQPDLVVGFGGYTAGPGGIAAWLSKVPLLIHEQNAAPGMTNKLLSRFAQRTLLGFKAAADKLKQGIWVGNPVRQDICDLIEAPQKPVNDTLQLLIIGGSLGAEVLNQNVPVALQKWTDPELRITHQVGKGREQETVQRYQQAGPGVKVEVVEFIEDMAAAYQQADLVLCRAGALTVAELACAGVASILVPYPYAVDDHQTRNAEVLVSAQAAILLPQSQLNASSLFSVLQELAIDPERLQHMGEQAKTVASSESTQKIVQHCQELMKERAVS
ncbi:undecaprenyldiphospho-muramoylpentapeptide beta-N-acetylglucosaminyltransferase [Aliidiomarina minuta]|uniref:UDP-N-acetylglucosamine--N-acetylmuramyl-(pentapeptide) pyrophosphoryl-undecaprenol N-acetylglucosamine transferase n=1 Tax=Aliidiomarina minuta TaxID=880057 RepID=A0A432W8Z0_9GAMM|nr:undecaprenyldiphospho-muramoylpentapeptide beta-N-acetylglucosaminyltransferase [Aliidiomarina minuta]RUO26620.1 undecaprenyldiphospho-muramoylpentapeptide beta-N-acetylglucosaminyltransferase [Aliidiomarina minuta]